MDEIVFEAQTLVVCVTTPLNWHCAGIVDEIVFEAQTLQVNDAGDYKQDSQFINGFPNFTCVVREHVKNHESKMIRIRSLDGDTLQEVEFHNFPPGSAVALRYLQHHSVISTLLELLLSVSSVPLVKDFSNGNCYIVGARFLTRLWAGCMFYAF